MEELINYQNILLKNVHKGWNRYLFQTLHTDERLLGVKGLRGVGKTTLLLQYLKSALEKGDKGLFVTAEHPYFYQNSLFDLASLWVSYGGELLLIDEIHKYANWSRELKLIYDGFPGLKVIFTSSSALDLFQGESDLSRRLDVQVLHGLSFREYLSLNGFGDFDSLRLDSVLDDSMKISREITNLLKTPVLPLFKDYLSTGYFPFSREINKERIPQRLIQILNTVLESDLSMVEGYSASNVTKIKNLLGVIAESVPFEPNISKLAEKMHLGRNTVNIYLKNLEDAKILNLLYEQVKGISQLQKPAKIYLENSNFLYAFQHTPSSGTIRETFILNQLRNSEHLVGSSKKGDFKVDENWVIEVGGRNKDNSQIKNLENAFLAIDDLEIGFGNKIPLWLFGFLY
ncbi:ATP-binding protein [Algoriphagus formosus]|uniref:ATP-binding protein n=1 Tax=Algoriphagus formosus TaxID=2007308 RepID=A0A4R5UW11_9BACT|nr:AAA family ATPase [Algoriphagus aquimaris]TDK43440.1 ATP-binding protein [Algoriphagus aquimaris]